ncbi:hypothetical protein [uncultured Bilophila sp.]|uniref:hypothetical protein n=1 Tax=uncultured Bilophila sp. TaxID=529385 RepID=UPI00280B8176|nr:hypothetical protein [uncultured Bilophila sp.]
MPQHYWYEGMVMVKEIVGNQTGLHDAMAEKQGHCRFPDMQPEKEPASDAPILPGKSLFSVMPAERTLLYFRWRTAIQKPDLRICSSDAFARFCQSSRRSGWTGPERNQLTSISQETRKKTVEYISRARTCFIGS